MDTYKVRHDATYNPRYDNSIWKDVTGVVREIKNMDSMHLCLVALQCQVATGKGSNGLKRYKLPVIIDEINKRIKSGLLSKDYYYSCISAIYHGSYKFYPNEKGMGLENYYVKMSSTYWCIDPPEGLEW